MARDRKPNDLFNTLNSINNKTALKGGYDKKEVPAYILSLWLSHNSKVLESVSKINYYHFTIPDELIFLFYKKDIPKGRRFIKWTKKEKTKLLDDAKKLSEKYGISVREALMSM